MLKKIKIVLFDSDDYMSSLVGYLCKKCQDVVETRVFTDWNLLRDYVKKGQADVLLASEDCAGELAQYTGQVPQMIFLSEEQEQTRTEGLTLVFKYQPASDIVKEIFALASENDRIMYSQGKISKKTVEIISGYTPFGDGMTEYLFDRAEKSSKQKKSLYVSLEEFHAFSFLAQGKTDEAAVGRMSEVLFFLRQKREKLALKLKSLLYTRDGLDCIFSVEDYRDLHEMTKKDMKDFLQVLLFQTEYESIFFSAGILSEAILYLFAESEKIVMPRPKNPIQIAKDQSFQQNMRRQGREDILEKRIFF